MQIHRRKRSRSVYVLHHFLFLLPLLTAWPAALHGATYEVGPGQSYTTLASLPTLSPGDVVEVASGTYHEVKRWTDAGSSSQPITIRGIGATRPVIDASGQDVSGSLPAPRAVFQIEASNVIIQNFELVNAANGDNGSGVRVTTFGSLTTNVTIQNCYIHANDMGIMSDNDDKLLIQGCEVAFNGTSAYAGYSHNFYLGGLNTTVEGCYIHDATEGQNVKSRGHFTALLYNYIANSQDGEIGLVDAAETNAANSNAVILGNIILSKNRGSGWNSTRFIQFGEDLGGPHTGTLFVINNTCISGTSSINFLWSDEVGANLVASNNIFIGSNTLSSGNSGTLSGSSNWAATTASIPAGLNGTVLGSDPGFTNAAGNDYHLLSTSPCRNIGVDAPSYIDGNGVTQSAVPTLDYQAVNDLVNRASDTHLDAGALGYGLGAASSSTTTGTTTGTTTTSSTSTTGGTTSTTGSSGSASASASSSASGSGGSTTASSPSTSTPESSSRGGCGMGGGVALLIGLVAYRHRRTRPS